MTLSNSAVKQMWEGVRVLVLSPTPTHPQDYGNRKRVFQVCKRIADGGGRICFVHYPSEAEWRNAIPSTADRAMAVTWHQYFTVPPTQELHRPPKHDHHDIDEWWDPSIGAFLQWLFQAQTFDAFIVNYAWLSKAFEFAPKAVFKILDMHDKLSGRRELLESSGVAPEFFFTTEEQEARALARADLVWAIKETERTEFARMSPTAAITVPHLDPPDLVARRSLSQDGYLRIGFLGARNSINRVSVTSFLKEALPLFRDWFAPIRFLIAGSVCDELEDIASPFVELQGRVSDVREFYASVDCIAVPMRFSTGLKIKTGEALSLGVPIVATAHAFDGYEPAHPLHSLTDFMAMAKALIDLSFNPRATLDSLAAASSRSYDETAKSIDKAFATTRATLRRCQPSVAVAVDARALVDGTIFNMLLRSICEFARTSWDITVLVVKGDLPDIVARAATIPFRPVVVAQDLVGASSNEAVFAVDNIVLRDIGEFLDEKGIKILFCDALHPAFQRAQENRMAVFVRPETVALSAGTTGITMPNAESGDAFIVSNSPSRELAALQAATGASSILAPHFFRSPRLKRLRPSAPPHIVMLGSPETNGVAAALGIAAAWRVSVRLVRAVGEPLELPPARQRDMTCVSAQTFLAGVASGTEARPLFALDFSSGGVGLQLCREILDRLMVPVVSGRPFAASMPMVEVGWPLTVSTEFGLIEIFRDFLLNPAALTASAFDTARFADYEMGAGWECISALWSFLGSRLDDQVPT